MAREVYGDGTVVNVTLNKDLGMHIIVYSIILASLNKDLGMRIGS